MKNIYSICAITLFIFLGACQSADEKRTCEILEKMNNCWNGVSLTDTEAVQRASACESTLEIEFTALKTKPLESEKTRVEPAQQSVAQCLVVSTEGEGKQCITTYFQTMEEIFNCK